MEFPHLVRLVEENQFDTIYHEHFSYFSFSHGAADLRRARLDVFDVEEIPTHGGSLRIYARHDADDDAPGDRARSPPAHGRARAGLDRLELLHVLRRACEGAEGAVRPAGVPHRREARREVASSDTAHRARATRC